MNKEKPEVFFREAETVIPIDKRNIKKWLCGFTLLLLFSSNSYSHTGLYPYFFKERLALITGFNDNNTWFCMAYLESSDFAVTTEECAERIQNATEPFNLKLQRETGEPLAFILSPDKTTKGVRYLRPESGIPSETELSTDLYPIFDPAPNVHAWYPDVSHGLLTFHSMPLLMRTGEPLQIENTTTIPYLVSGSPVVHNGSPVCILSKDGRCTSYDKSSCMKFCNEPGCSIIYRMVDPSKRNNKVVSVECADLGSATYWCEFFLDGSGSCGENVWACKKKSCIGFFEENQCKKSSDDKQLQCKANISASVGVAVVGAVVISLVAYFSYYKMKKNTARRTAL